MGTGEHAAPPPQPTDAPVGSTAAEVATFAALAVALGQVIGSLFFTPVTAVVTTGLPIRGAAAALGLLALGVAWKWPARQRTKWAGAALLFLATIPFGGTAPAFGLWAVLLTASAGLGYLWRNRPRFKGGVVVLALAAILVLAAMSTQRQRDSGDADRASSKGGSKEADSAPGGKAGAGESDPGEDDKTDGGSERSETDDCIAADRIDTGEPTVDVTEIYDSLHAADGLAIGCWRIGELALTGAGYWVWPTNAGYTGLASLDIDQPRRDGRRGADPPDRVPQGAVWRTIAYDIAREEDLLKEGIPSDRYNCSSGQAVFITDPDGFVLELIGSDDSDHFYRLDPSLIEEYARAVSSGGLGLMMPTAEADTSSGSATQTIALLEEPLRNDPTIDDDRPTIDQLAELCQPIISGGN